jgi:hypothetical protein
VKYIYTKGPWKEYYGYVFYNYRPTEITDNATLERIKKEQDFQQFIEEPENGEIEEGQGQASTPVLKGKECPKCHQLIPRGWYMHQKWCRVVS